MTEVNAAAQTQQAQSQSKLATAGLADNFDTFLTLLTEQLKNQDPLDPLESEQFVQQLVQFSSVEQQIASNESLEALLALQQSDAQLKALDFIGKEATVNTRYNLLQDGEATWEYGLSQEADSVEILIFDEKGTQVRRLDGETGEGVHAVTWDGKDQAGNTLPEGVYEIEIIAKDADKNAIDYATRVSHRVTGVEMSGGQAQVSFANGELVLPASLVTSVREASSAPANSNTSSPDEESEAAA
ncbi:MAG: flagellar hook capping protein [Oceanicaulis sp.]|jgi:flagellar basal-body rod modification protein FlgD|uniref:flagellar hook assembly protein FlgD n=1 Tax=unclassified Oceanicaulis TaxID=2632123 RepID=UPI000C5E70F2|nr:MULTISPECIES: flagellar hook assembly protein FlgD [unclassified Oceanicaulis]MAB69957.1 flagellar hook capping protein [Oceanicaulis sp.]MBC40133.1 flagellar hook capping protein [Oceanicaulis sp.]MBG36982.1 flagellar hook capping protein [Oceanicaulis sp.]HBU61148.1 flagellar hook capping protein [Oceanicaulis sp.]HCR94318.1 flagellar hook capping protein [Oceanicaulis sp.]